MTTDNPTAHSEPRSAEESAFSDLMTDVMSHAERFGHREHIHLAWLAVRRYGAPKAVDLVSRGIQRAARDAGAPEKYNATMSRAWVELVGYHAGQSPVADFDAFVEINPALLEKTLLGRFYRPGTLVSPRARAEWIDPDLASFPWDTAPDANPSP